MKPKKLILLTSLFIVIGIALTFLLYFTIVIDSIRVFPMDVELGYNPGISGDTDTIDFGRLSLAQPGHATKFVRLNNAENHPTFVTVSFSGEMAPWAEAVENNFVLDPQTEKELELRIYSPENVQPGNYTGKAKIVMKRYWG